MGMLETHAAANFVLAIIDRVDEHDDVPGCAPATEIRAFFREDTPLTDESHESGPRISGASRVRRSRRSAVRNRRRCGPSHASRDDASRAATPAPSLE